MFIQQMLLTMSGAFVIHSVITMILVILPIAKTGNI